MFRESYLLVILSNHSRRLELQTLRHGLYREFGCVSALAFEPVIPVLSSGSPIPKEPLLHVSRGGAHAPPELSFTPPQLHRRTIFFPLASAAPWESLRDHFRSDRYPTPLYAAVESPESSEQEGADATSPVPSFPGIFIAEVDEPTPTFAYTLPEPSPWRSYKLAVYHLEYPGAHETEWWNGCRWNKSWELSVRAL